MHYNTIKRTKVKSSTFYIDLFLFGEIVEYARFYQQSVSVIIEQAIIFSRQGGEFEKALSKSQRCYKKNNILRKKRKFKNSKSAGKTKEAVSKSLFECEFAEFFRRRESA